MKRLIHWSFALLLIVACKKTENEDNGTCEQTVNKIAGVYQITKMESDEGSPGTFVDVTNDPFRIPVCVKDNIITLNSNGTAAYADAGTKCTPEINDNNGSWSLPAPGKIRISFPTEVLNTANADIVSFDCTTLVMLLTDSEDGVTIRTKLTFRKQL